MIPKSASHAFCFFVIACGLANPNDALAEVSERIHQRCLDARDYSGCVKSMKRNNQTSTKEMIGIGLQISLNLDTADLFVYTVIKNSPAFKGGVRPGDRIMKIDGKSTKGMGLKEAARLIKGKKGTKVKLELERVDKDSASKSINIALIREKFTIKKHKLSTQKTFREWFETIPNDLWDIVPRGNFQQKIRSDLNGGIEM